jgi:hypothetical protein
MAGESQQGFRLAIWIDETAGDPCRNYRHFTFGIGYLDGYELI